MQKYNYENFTLMLLQAYGMYQVKITTPTIDKMFEMLYHLDFELIRTAMDKHLSISTYPPTVADVLKHAATGGQQSISADEAWGLVPKAETESSVTNSEIMGAWGVAQSIYDDGDKVGARVAFRAAYERLEAERVANGRDSKWWPTLGHDFDGRERAIIEARDANRITIDFAGRLLADNRPGDCGPFVALLTGSETSIKPPPLSSAGRSALDAIKANLDRGKAAAKLPYALRAKRLANWLESGRSEDEYYMRRGQAEEARAAAEKEILSRKPIDLPAAAEELQATARAENGEPRMIRPGDEVTVAA